ncbi:MAG: signal peptide peptidase SppA, partial [Planctomycetota bacterium]
VEDHRRQVLAALGEDLAAVILDGAAAGRGRDPAALRELTEQAPFLTAGQAAEAGLIDGELPFDAVLDRLAEAVGAAADDLPQIDLADWIEVCGRDEPRPRPGRSVVAVAYAEGEIVDGESDSEVGGATLARELRRLRNDPDVAAVVLRVNSPGGSAAASERIRREIELLREVKPVVVSMGDLAASGGYWISCTADRIFARPGTITGSIGVFGVFPNVAGLADKAGVSPQVVRIGEHADADSPWRRKSEAELGAIQAEVDAVYEAFLDRVAAGRGLDREVVHEIGQGRVWSGRAALELGLVDDLGGLDAAIAAAAEAAGLDRDYAVRWPAGQGGLFERLLAELEQEEQPLAGSEAVVIRRLAGGAAAAARLAAAGRVQARPPFRIDARF